MRDKMDRVVFTVTAVATAVLWLLGSGAAMAAQEPQEKGYGTEFRITRDVETTEGGRIRGPASRYRDDDGKKCRPDSWGIVTVPGQDVSRRPERKMVYTSVEGAEETPGSISLKEGVSGSQAEGTLFLRENRIVREGWQDGLAAPVTLHVYGADGYHGDSLVIPRDVASETCMSMGGQLSGFMGLSPLKYRILFAN